jgi:NAD(P)H-nitrite reductase large subunit
MIERDAAKIAKETTACIINRLSGPRIATSALGRMFDVPNSNIALAMKITRGKVLMVYAALSVLRCS